MELTGTVAVITGAGHGIGAALAQVFAAECAAVVVADRDGDAAKAVADALTTSGATAHPYTVDVTDESQIVALIADTNARFGPVDVMVSNAGIATGEGIEAATDVWNNAYAVNVLAHVYAANACLPSMRERGRGALVQLVSAAALTTMIGDAPYTVTKHAALGLAEWLAVTYGAEGIQVTAVCPQGVETQLLREQTGVLGERIVRAAGDVLTPNAVATKVRDGVRRGDFLVLPHPDVATFAQAKRADPQGWIAGMQRFAARVAREA